MENLQVEVESLLKLAGFLSAGLAYFYTLKNSFNILHERQKVARSRIECLEIEVRSLKEILTILKTQHEEKHCAVKRKSKRT